ncbi:MAG: hypothetical protein ACHQ15_05180 [Candidatus Limnocylindrales bacterium]
MTPNQPLGTEPTPEPASTTDRWVEQLQRMIDEISRQAVPVMREVAAKAAELAAVAGEKAGPLAHKAAEKTEAFGIIVAERGKVMAADLRRAASETAEAPAPAETTSEPPVEATPVA